MFVPLFRGSLIATPKAYSHFHEVISDVIAKQREIVSEFSARFSVAEPFDTVIRKFMSDLGVVVTPDEQRRAAASGHEILQFMLSETSEADGSSLRLDPALRDKITNQLSRTE